MPKSCSLSIGLCIILSVLNILSAQNRPRFKDVVLDGKEAKLNLETGEITLVKGDKSKVVNGFTGDTATAKLNPIPVYHKVRENETLLDISRKYQLSLNELKAINGLETTLVSSGEILRVSNNNGDNIESPIDETGKSSIKATSSIKTEKLNNSLPYHLVKENETLYSISRLRGLSIEELKHFNDLSSNLIRVGQKLRIIEQEKNNHQSSTDFIIIKKGDTLYSLAKRFNSSVDNLRQLNGLTTNLILVGQKLRIK